MERQKYPRTFHLPWSPCVHSDDKVIHDTSHFIGKEVVVTEKLDGENTSFYHDYYHARSIDSRFNYTRSWIATMHATLRHDIPKNISLIGENMWAEHSIRYNDLNGYFYLFSMWDSEYLGNTDGEDFCLHYDDIVEWAEMLDLPMPKILYRGEWDEKAIQKLSETLDFNTIEGYVVRTTEGFLRSETNLHIAKIVRAGHVQDDSEHWLKNAKQNGKLKGQIKPAFMS